MKKILNSSKTVLSAEIMTIKDTGQTLWGFPIMVSDEMKPGQIAVFNEQHEPIQIRVHKTAFHQANSDIPLGLLPPPGTTFRILNHPQFKNKKLTVLQAYKDSDEDYYRLNCLARTEEEDERT